ncbi:hypothetical protein BB021_08235 [Elizabethkingia ursingii]|uniref:DUF3592 domain-containing protein n=2 Tax=Elizabethkingia ursingii TaxID=1756150 RepID=A0ABX3NC57_9FLAO|nr:hypothetical protein BB021_08235 [Elizabethkingia ursingii]
MNKSNRKLLIIFSVFIVILIIGSIIFYSLTYEKGKYNRIIQMERNTTVLSIYENSSEHNNTYVLYKNGERKSLNYDLKVGDSISKNKGDSIMYIYRKDSIIPVNLLLYGDKVN